MTLSFEHKFLFYILKDGNPNPSSLKFDCMNYSIAVLCVIVILWMQNPRGRGSIIHYHYVDRPQEERRERDFLYIVDKCKL